MRDDLTGRTLLGRLRVIRSLGSGAFGAVYEVEALADGARCALKVLRGEDGMSPVAASRLVREAGIAARVGSPRLVRTFEVGQLEDGRPFLLMELLHGETWKAYVARRGRLRAADAVRLAVQVTEGLMAAHAAGVVHRDLKPDNVFLVGEPGDEQVKLLDFGLAKNLPGHTDAFGHMTDAGSLMGTPRYVSPEQGAGRPDIDGRVDEYALGVMLYEALSGRPAFPGGSLAEILLKIAEGRVEPLAIVTPDVPPELAAVVARAMHVDRDRRYPSAAALAEALAPHARGGPVFASSTAPMEAHRPAPPSTRSTPDPARLASTLASSASIGSDGSSRSASIGSASSSRSASIGSDGSSRSASIGSASSSRSASIGSDGSSRSASIGSASSSAPARPLASQLAWLALGLFLVLGLLGVLAAVGVFLLQARDAGPVARSPDAPVAPGAEPVAAPVDPSHPFSPPRDERDAAAARELEQLFDRGLDEECLARAEHTEPSARVLELRVICAANAHCWDLYRRLCAELEVREPSSPMLAHSCDRLVPYVPPGTPGDCHYPP